MPVGRVQPSPIRPVEPVSLTGRFPPLHRELMLLLRGLNEQDWIRPTSCALWSVKDIVAHLLDTALRRLAYGRDQFSPVPDKPVSSYQDLVAHLNQLNADWVRAARRLSSQVLIDLLDAAAGQVHEYFA